MPWVSDMVPAHFWVTLQAFPQVQVPPLSLPSLDPWLETASLTHLGNYDNRPASDQLVSLGLRTSELPKITQSPVKLCEVTSEAETSSQPASCSPSKPHPPARHAP